MDEAQPTTTVSGGISNLTGKAVKKARLAQSRFLLTINTNKGYDSKHQNELENDSIVLDEQISYMLNNLGEFIKFRDLSHSWTKDHIENVEMQYAIEVGEKYKKLHAHCGIFVKHRSNIQLDKLKIKNFIEEQLGIQGVRVDIKLLPKDSGMTVLDYINKKMTPEFEEVE